MFDTETFTSEAEKRPPLYNIKLQECSNRELKIQLWEEITVELYKDWSEINVKEVRFILQCRSIFNSSLLKLNRQL